MTLRIDGSRVREEVRRLRQESDDPVCAYVYDIDALRTHVRAMREALPAGCELYYAAKANADAPVLAAIAPWVDGFEAASGGELRWLRAHQPGKPLLFGGPGKLDADIRDAIAIPGCTLHVESLGELRRLAAIAHRTNRTASVFLRMNIGVDGVGDTRLMMGGKPTPFGMDEADLPAALAILRDAPRLTLEGFHFHLMSHQCDAAIQLRLVNTYLDIVHRWQRDHGVAVTTVNAGGGFGVDYADPSRSFDWAAFCEGLGRLLADRNETLRLRFEPGRFVSVACGWYVMEVLDVKRSHGEWFAVAHGGTHHFRTPPAQGHDHPFVVWRGHGDVAVAHEKVTLVGQLCTPKDVLARRQPVDALAPGDCLAFPLAGAYAWNISHQNFLMHPPPRMLYLPPCDAAGVASRHDARCADVVPSKP
ncbi:type III PLP-dependent enzyme [Luteibacter sahnii]|uniref:type III PLP-dependent enzyme n=1 Tax=Luteibacter sahnii TaxID=3021977 RepID=UPI002A6ADC0B|nr:type III PLP-dependent enzyme [Luteibacter sp. PPL193]MDY1549895.1 type III PLP-dependent enzyme [Luteibacter sp. PPL193]